MEYYTSAKNEGLQIVKIIYIIVYYSIYHSATCCFHATWYFSYLPVLIGVCLLISHALRSSTGWTDRLHLSHPLPCPWLARHLWLRHSCRWERSAACLPPCVRVQGSLWDVVQGWDCLVVSGIFRFHSRCSVVLHSGCVYSSCGHLASFSCYCQTGY